MKRIASLVLVGLLSACNSSQRHDQSARTSSSSDTDRSVQARATRFNSQPTTTMSAEQRVSTDPRDLRDARLAVARGGPAAGKRDDKLQPFALFYGPMPTDFTFSRDGRLFVAFPRWGRITNYTVGEVVNGRLTPFPDAQTNSFFPDQPRELDPRTHLVSVQSVVCDSANRVWLLDTGSIDMQPVIDGGPKMWAYDLTTGRRVKEITFEAVVKKNSYLNDVRFDLSRGDAGVAYITDSGAGGIIVVDIASGHSWRKLENDSSVMADKSLTMNVEGQPLKKRPAGGGEEPVLINSDGIALSPDGKTLYYTPLTSHSVYAVSTDFLADQRAGMDSAAAVKKVGEKPSANDGLICDQQGRIYSTDFEDNAIRRLTPGKPDSSAQVVVQDERLLWPDCVMIHDGQLYVTSNQLHRQPNFNRGQDVQQMPFVLFRMPIDAQEKARH